MASDVPPQAGSSDATSPVCLSFDGMLWVPGGTFQMGSNLHYPEERPAHPVALDGFWIDRYPVTNAEFARFVAETGYRTAAEVPANPADYPGALPGMLSPGSLVFVQPDGPVNQNDASHWWRFERGAMWRRPDGPNSSLAGKQNHPVVHVTFDDAVAFAKWSGKTLPTEAEWEFAARGGLDRATYAWGNELRPGGRAMANIWQGEFPWENLAHDGFQGTSPVGSFPPNGYGLYDMIGNVWEWTMDWYEETDAQSTATTCCTPAHPHGIRWEARGDFNHAPVAIPRKVLKGGSYLCAPNFCRRYRPAARHPQPIDTSTSHVGFRCVVRTPAG